MHPTNALTAEAFFELVEGLLGPSMAALGYHRIHGSVNDQSGSRGDLTSGRRTTDSAPFVRFDYGFEGSAAATRLVGPSDPQSEEEW